MAGYHQAEIKRGVYGELSKISEELEELYDAESQGNRIMMLIELADLIGAVEGYLQAQYKGFTLLDLTIMSAATRRAFESGERK